MTYSCQSTPQQPPSISRVFSTTLTSILLVACVCATAMAESLKSPNGRIEVQVDVKEVDLKTRLNYRVKLDGDVLVDDSTVTFVGSDNVVIGDHLNLVRTPHPSSYRETWKPVYGERSEIVDNFNFQTFQCQDTEAKCSFYFEVRCYDQGVAFRTLIGSSKPLKPIQERSEFCFPGDPWAWRTTSAQGEYDKVRLADLGANVERPLTIQLGPYRYAAIAEAAAIDYPMMRLKSVPRDKPTVVSQLQGEVTSDTTLTTPWRVILVGNTPGDLLLNNDLILNLNMPCAIADTSWIKPGKVLREISLTNDGAKAAVDFAAANNFQYVEFDAGWYGYEYDDASDATTVTLDPKRSAGPLDLQEMIKYADERGIGIIVYVNRRALEKQLDEILPLYKSWGIAGVKYGFVNTGSQKWTSWLHEAVRKAAEHQLMVDIHDEYRPVGYSRTYPNLMTQEGVCGDEAKPSTSLALTTLFTRNLAGAADHTICYFDPRVDQLWSHGQQLAKAVCTYSPWQFMYWYDTPLTTEQDGKTSRSRIVDSPELEFFQEVPTVWDETKVIHGEIGEYAVIARRSGDVWYVGAMNANEKRELSLPLKFLNPGTQYQARRYFDDPSLETKTKVRIENQPVDSTTELTISLLPNQGEAIRITPK
ncbi:alpha-glucosidase [Blastopirellula marina]|uniref:Alpha-glucosidase n=1 Tax=Blastopirellula marina TaxID=124 RepID=A0A2S8FM68_9BACT|nr:MULTISPECIES: glycoside hydrolase family 97 protein [Pirellulaceae]PQO33283.1 alpha-glucosidase [Blastopirellula marina]RCS52372.1 alpha-glucosidase [Bremerella cremea]